VCDISTNQCDAFCCCDPDCGQAVLDEWNKDQNTYCENYIGQKHKPLTKCMDMRYIYDYNIRKDKGMNATVEDGELCVELDTGSSFSQYVMPVGTVDKYPEPDYSLSSMQTSTEVIEVAAY
jgi:hypothetical protein